MRVKQANLAQRGVAMRKIYSIAPITLEAADRAYPLLTAIAPTVSLDEWRRFCRAAASPLAGDERASGREQAALAVDSRKHVKGLCIYSIRDHWFYGRLLDVPVFIAASAADAHGVAIELLQFLPGGEQSGGLLGRAILDDGRTGLEPASQRGRIPPHGSRRLRAGARELRPGGERRNPR